MNELENKIMDIAKSDLGISISNKYTNRVMLNGFLIQAPKFITNEKTGVKSCSLIIHQISTLFTGSILDKTFSAICYAPQIVEKLKEIDRPCFINIIGTFERNKKQSANYCQMYEYEIACWLDEKLLPAYQKEK